MTTEFRVDTVHTQEYNDKTWMTLSHRPTGTVISGESRRGERSDMLKHRLIHEFRTLHRALPERDK